jgi:N6-L-threonylcarbamoyladenine synthase/protein kinase Bud32
LICLGIEGTAEKTGVGIVDNEGKILAMAGNPLIPEKGGIHPREAAEHHSYWIPKLVKEVINDSDIKLNEIDLISFSRGPGLGPALRTVATASRALALSLNVPIVGVNHCVSHAEIGKLDTGAIDPVTLYVSGGNSQIIAYESGKYRIFGETLDIAIGNCLDHFARECGLSHPGGPIIEKLAKKGNYIDLPYSVKGMDFSFSGLFSAAIRGFKAGLNIEDICFSLQETAFSSLVEVCERALSHTNKTEIMLCGGVAANSRLREMLAIMAQEHYSEFFIPKMSLCGDNGAMIAWMGILTSKYFSTDTIENTNVIQKYRTDEVEVPWAKINNKKIVLPKNILNKGAEANIIENNYLNKNTIDKIRITKSYRIKEIDEKLRSQRTKNEAKLLSNVKKFGIKTPILYGIDLNKKTISMEKIPCPSLKSHLIINKNLDKLNINNRTNLEIFNKIGEKIAILHENKIVHGDLTISNILYNFNEKNLDKSIVFIDFGLGKYSNLYEDKADDLLQLKKSLQIISEDLANKYFEKTLISYVNNSKNLNYNQIKNKIKEIENRGRYHNT